MSTNQRNTMSFFARQLLPNVLLSTLIVLGIATAQIIERADSFDDRFLDKYQRFTRGYKRPTVTLDSKILEQARRTLSHLSPEARRFLFSPTIQNTITNLNHNTNTQEIQQAEGLGRSQGTDRTSSQILGYVNEKSGAVEYDLRGKIKKICFIVG